jgi:hypothetical protein
VRVRDPFFRVFRVFRGFFRLCFGSHQRMPHRLSGVGGVALALGPPGLTAKYAKYAKARARDPFFFRVVSVFRGFFRLCFGSHRECRIDYPALAELLWRSGLVGVNR